MLLRLQTPSSWSDFESLCHMLWKEIWQDPNAQKNGRSGQAQHGVDIFGKPLYQQSFEGVQCKDKDGRLGSKLTRSELLKECNNARKFIPALSGFTLAASCPNDAVLQQEARLINDNKAFPFDVNIWFWDEIEAEVRIRANLMEAFYRGFPIETDSSIKISATASKDHFNAFFTRPNLWDGVDEKLRVALKSLSYELCDNAYRYGKARNVKISFDGIVFQIQDDGQDFNPIDELPKYEAKSLEKYLGSLEFQHFLKKYGDIINISYSPKPEFKNTIKIEIKSFTAEPLKSQEITLDLSNMWGRKAGRDYANSLRISDDIEELILNFDNEAALSTVAEILLTLRRRLLDNVRIIVLVGEDSGLFGRDGWIKGVEIKRRS